MGHYDKQIEAEDAKRRAEETERRRKAVEELLPLVRHLHHEVCRRTRDLKFSARIRADLEEHEALLKGQL